MRMIARPPERRTIFLGRSWTDGQIVLLVVFALMLLVALWGAISHALRDDGAGAPAPRARPMSVTEAVRVANAFEERPAAAPAPAPQPVYVPRPPREEPPRSTRPTHWVEGRTRNGVWVAGHWSTR